MVRISERLATENDCTFPPRENLRKPSLDQIDKDSSLLIRRQLGEPIFRPAMPPPRAFEERAGDISRRGERERYLRDGGEGSQRDLLEGHSSMDSRRGRRERRRIGSMEEW